MKPTPTSSKPAFTSHSKETGTHYTIYVHSPKKPPREAMPSVLVMDGDYLFDPAVQACQTLVEEGRIPPSVVVGVGYGAGFGKPGNYRGRDYTPTASKDEPLSGGADRFLEYITRSLWPELAQRHRLNEKKRVIAGHSLGSLLVLHALFQKDPFFNLALASAPSIWWDDRSILGLVSKLRAHQATLDGRLYLGVGEADSPSMLADLGLLEKQLKEKPFKGLHTLSEQFPGRNHYNAAPDTLTAGLASLLA